MKPLVFTEKALSALSGLEIDFDRLLVSDEWPAGDTTVHTGQKGIFVFTSQCDATSRLLVIRRKKGGLFDAVEPEERRSVFDRCARVALRSFDKSRVTLNPKWMAFHHDNRVSIFASGIGSNMRIVADVNVGGSGDTYLFDYAPAEQVQDLASLQPDVESYEAARADFEREVSKVDSAKPQIEGNIELDQLDPVSITKGLSYEDWERLLSPRQREFVERELTGPLRLRGTAGTGKTLAMVMKAVRMRRTADKNGGGKRFLFLTHSWAMAEHVDGMLEQIDRREPGNSTLDVYPLLEVARRRDYTKIGRQPLGFDSEEGKRKALSEIGSVIEGFRLGDWLAYKGGCTATFIEALENAGARSNFTWDLLIEFGCVLAAQGILGRQSELDRYLRIRRMAYMMPLANPIEKEVIFKLWSAFLERLKELKMISSDQIISDLLNDLQTFYWEAARTEEGYDVIFVDEAHLFNAQERLTFHHLLNEGDAPPLVIMALDPKQSPRELFVDIVDEDDTGTSNVYDRARLAGSESIDLIDVYRYTPQIEQLIRCVLNAMPGLGLDGDWDIPLATSGLEDGPVPTFSLVSSRLESFNTGIKTARNLLPGARARSGRVAVLCMDQDRFFQYRPAAGRNQSRDLFVVTSRDDVARLPFMSRRIVFSTPEYVAGLQFDTVILLDVNRDLVPDGAYRGHQQRRFLSELYLGLSRAEYAVVIMAARDGDGLSPFLDAAIRDGALREATA